MYIHIYIYTYNVYTHIHSCIDVTNGVSLNAGTQNLAHPLKGTQGLVGDVPLGVAPQVLSKLSHEVYWVAVEELHLRYYNPKTMLLTIYDASLN